MEKQPKPQPETASSGGKEPPRRRTAVATNGNRADRVLRIISTMNSQELTELSSLVQEMLITK
jgi:hypothetical protein